MPPSQTGWLANSSVGGQKINVLNENYKKETVIYYGLKIKSITESRSTRKIPNDIEIPSKKKTIYLHKSTKPKCINTATKY